MENTYHGVLVDSGEIVFELSIEDGTSPEEAYTRLMEYLEVPMNKPHRHNFDFITVPEALDLLVISEEFLEYLDQHEVGPPAFRNGSSRVYDRSAVITWGIKVGLLESGDEEPTSEDPVNA